jgi:ssDNA-binding replication factor A large subunit
MIMLLYLFGVPSVTRYSLHVKEWMPAEGKKLTHQDFTLKDDMGALRVSVWGDHLRVPERNSTVTITNVVITEFRGAPGASTTEESRIEVIHDFILWLMVLVEIISVQDFF